MSRTRSLPIPGLAVGLSAVLGAVGFLTRVPVGNSERAWSAFVRFPATMVLVAYPIGAVLSGVLVVGVPPATAGVAFPGLVVALLGIAHLDGVADLGDAAVVHGGPERRLDVMRDTTVGVGAVVGVVLVIAGLVAGAATLASAPWQVAVSVVVAAEVSAKLGMVAVAGAGTATHEGLGSAFTERTALTAVVPAAVLAVPAALGPAVAGVFGHSWPAGPALAAVGGGVLATAAVFWWAQRNLGGVTGDVFGAANEFARVVALHAGVVAWMRL